MKQTLLLLALAVPACNADMVDDIYVPPRDMAHDAAVPLDFTAPRDFPGPPDFAGVPDLTAPASPDLTASMDLRRRDDLSGAGCHMDADCRLFSSYCANQMPCTCVPLPSMAPDPPCNGKMIQCLVDPCAKKMAVCDLNSGICTVQ